VIAHDLETSKYIFQMMQLMYEKYDLWKPRYKRANVKEISFAGTREVL